MYQTEPKGNVGSEYIDIYGEKSQQSKEGGEVRKKSAKCSLFSFDGFPYGRFGTHESPKITTFLQHPKIS